MGAGAAPEAASTSLEDVRLSPDARDICAVSSGNAAWLVDAVPPPWLDEESWPADPEDPRYGAGPELVSLSAGFAQGQPLDTGAPEVSLAVTADLAAGPLRDRPAPDADPGLSEHGYPPVRGCGPSRPYDDVSDDELVGMIGARQRLQARQAWEMYDALAELIRRRPAPMCQPPAAGELPAVWDEGTAAEAALQLATTTGHAHQLLALAWELKVKLPATACRFRDGLLDEYRAKIIAAACANLTPAEARQAEDILFGFPGTEAMTPWQIRDRIARAVAQVNPDAIRKRREEAAKRDARIWAGMEDSGNMMLMGRELPPAAVLAMDQNLTVRARELKAAGIPGTQRELRVLAFLERMGAANPLGTASPDSNGSDGNAGGPGGTPGPSPADGVTPGAGGIVVPVASVVHLTVPAVTLTQDADRPGEMRGAGPVDPGTCRDLADAAAASNQTSWEATITDPDGRPVAHACGKPAPPATRRPGRKRGTAAGGGEAGTGPPGRDPDPDGSPSLTKIADGPDPRYGTWQYTHGPATVIFEFEHLAGECDHRHQATGHDPGKHLRHLTAILNQECTSPVCTWSERASDYEHSVPFEQGGKTCLCEAGPVCRHDHRTKQRKGWKLREDGARGWFRWTTPAGRSYTKGTTSYPT